MAFKNAVSDLLQWLGISVWFLVLTRVCCVLQLAKDLLHPSVEEERRKCKLKRLVQSPNSYFMDVKCPGENMCTRLHTLG